MTLKELGELLRRERERKGLSVKQVMESTKISRRILVALEEGDRKNLPHPVYAKGFIRNYARLLDLNQAEVLEAVTQEFGVEEDEDRPHSRTNSWRAGDAPVPAASGRRVWPTVLLIFVLVIVLAAMVVYLQRRGALTANRAVAPQTQEQAASAAPQAAAPEAMTPSAAPAEQAAPSEGAPAPATPAAGAPAPAMGQPGAVQPGVVQPAVPAQESARPAAHTPGAKVLAVVAKPGQMCWMEVSVDGADKREFFIRSGESVSFEYTEKLWIKLGNVGGVHVTHNGKAVVTDGAGWSVKTLTFP